MYELRVPMTLDLQRRLKQNQSQRANLTPLKQVPMTLDLQRRLKQSVTIVLDWIELKFQ